jgi:hypothetical protein
MFKPVFQQASTVVNDKAGTIFYLKIQGFTRENAAKFCSILKTKQEKIHYSPSRI